MVALLCIVAVDENWNLIVILEVVGSRQRKPIPKQEAPPLLIASLNHDFGRRRPAAWGYNLTAGTRQMPV
jgi:hypothetical protein